MSSGFGNSKGGMSSFSGGGRGNKKKKLMILGGGLALIFVLFAVVIVVLVKKKNTGTEQAAIPVISDAPPVSGSITLYTPLKELVAGEKLTPEIFKEVYWPRTQIPEGAIRDLAEIQGKYAKTKIEPGTPMQVTMLRDDPVVESLPLTPGNRAVSIEVDQVSGLEGHAHPGTKVDVTLTYLQDKNLITKIIVQNARVLSYGGVTRAAFEGGKGEGLLPTGGNKTITLDASPSDALQIQTAKQMGKLGLLLRSQDDDKASNVSEVSSNDMNGGKNEKKDTSPKCTKGSVKMNGKEMIVGCDGSLSELIR